MTLLDLLQLIKRFLKYVVVIPIVCTVIMFVVGMILPKDYQAVAIITASAEAGAVGGIATTAATEASQNGTTVTAATNANAKQVTLTAKGHNAQECQQAASSAAQSAANRALESFPTQTFKVAEAQKVSDVSQSPMKLALVALFGALFVVICGIVVWDMVRRPIKSAAEVEALTATPVIGEIPSGDQGEKLFANVRFVAKDQLRTVCVVPVGDPSASRRVCEELYEAASALRINTEVLKADAHAEYLYAADVIADLNIIDCVPLSHGMGAAYLGRNADVVLLAVREWSDSAIQIESILNEFKIAKISLNGIVLLPEIKAAGKSSSFSLSRFEKLRRSGRLGESGFDKHNMG